MKLEYININSIKAYARNPRRNDQAIDAVAASIREFGAITPVILDHDNVIVAGHTRVAAARRLGVKEMPCVRAEGLSAAEINAYRIADNKTGEASDWDFPMLEVELEDMTPEARQALDEMGFGFEFEDAMVLTDSQGELDTEAYSEEAFEYTCQECGFMFNEK